MTARSGRAALKHRLSVLGIEVDNGKLDEIYEKFLKLADKKKDINDDDVLMLAGMERTANQRIKVDYLQVTSGIGVKSVASVGLLIAGEKFEAAASGNGPVDAAIKAMKQIIKRNMTLQEFTIQAITEEAMTWVKCICRLNTTVMCTTVSGHRYCGCLTRSVRGCNQ